MNKAILMGRLTRDPETRNSVNNIVYVTFTLAVNRRFSKEGAQQADFINIVAWGKTAEFISMYFKKGMQVGIIGRIQTRNYDDKDGKKVYVTEVLAEEAYFADSKHSSDAQPKISNNTSSKEETIDFGAFNEDAFKIETEDDISF